MTIPLQALGRSKGISGLEARLEDSAQDLGRDISDSAAGGEGENPGNDYLASDTPAYRRESASSAHPHDSRAGGVSGAQGDAKPGGQLDGYAGGCGGCESVVWLQLGQAHSHGPDDPPATEEGAQPHGARSKEDDPERDMELCKDTAHEQPQSEHPHELLAIVAAVAECYEGSGEKL